MERISVKVWLDILPFRAKDRDIKEKYIMAYHIGRISNYNCTGYSNGKAVNRSGYISKMRNNLTDCSR